MLLFIIYTNIFVLNPIVLWPISFIRIPQLITLYDRFYRHLLGYQ
jgi:hypothetical protein